MIKEIISITKAIVICDVCHHEYINSLKLIQKNNPRSCPVCRCKGKLSYNYGGTISQKQKDALSKSLKGRIPWIKGRTHTPETRKKLSESHKGQTPANKGQKSSLETRLKCSLAHKGKPLSEQHKQKLREINIRIMKERFTASKISFPNRGLKEINAVDNYIQPSCPFKLILDKVVVGYILDAYIEELNLVIEFDETSNHSLPKQIENDIIRETRIKNAINCKFFRIKEVDWNNNKNLILEELKKEFSK
jgi:hypothetical protein